MSRFQIHVMGTDGTNPQLIAVDTSGNVQVDLVTADVTNAGTFAVQAAQSGTWTVDLGAVDNAVLDTIAANTANLANCIIQDDSPFTPATGYLMMIGGEFDDAAPDSVDEGDAGNIRISANRCVYVNIRDNAGNERGLNIDASGNLTANITGTVTVASHAVTNAGTFAVQVDGTALTRLTDIETNTDFGAVVGGGVEATALRVTLASDSTGVLSIDDNSGSITVDNGGTFAVQAAQSGTWTVDLGANNDVTIDASSMVGTHDSTAPTNNIVIGAIRDDEVGSTAVTSADGDVTTLRTDKFGALKTTMVADATSQIKYAVIDAATSGDNTIVAAAGAGIKIRVLSAFLIAAGTVNARFESGAAGTALTGQMNLVVNTGFVLPYNPGGWFETADNTLLNLELSAAISVDGCISYVEV